MKILKLLFLSLFISQIVKAQDTTHAFAVRNYPVKNGNIFFINVIYGCYTNNGISIKSVADSVFAVDSGTVTSVFDMGDGQAVMIMDAKKRFVVYSALSNIVFTKNDRVRQGDFIGLIVQDDEGYTLDLIVSENKNYLPPLQVIKFLEKKNPGSISEITISTSQPVNK